MLTFCWYPSTWKKRQLKELPLLAKIIMQTSMLQEAMADTRDFDYDDIDPDRFLAEAIKARHWSTVVLLQLHVFCESPQPGGASSASFACQWHKRKAPEYSTSLDTVFNMYWHWKFWNSFQVDRSILERTCGNGLRMQLWGKAVCYIFKVFVRLQCWWHKLPFVANWIFEEMNYLACLDGL